MPNSCSSADIDELKSKLNKDGNAQIQLNDKGLPTYSGNNAPISGNDLACWMSIDLAKREIPANPAAHQGGYMEMYDNTLLAGMMWALLGATVLYYTVSTNK